VTVLQTETIYPEDTKVGPGKYCSPHHPTHIRPSSFDLNIFL
jgi:hypothetical protein